MRQGFVVPDETNDYIDYKTHESVTFKKLTLDWNEDEARRFVSELPRGKVVLKYPKASRVIRNWLRLMPHARVLYVFRQRDEAIAAAGEAKRAKAADPGPEGLGVPPELENMLGALKFTEGDDAAGTFSAFAAMRMGAGSAADRTARATERTADNTADLVREARQGGLVFG